MVRELACVLRRREGRAHSLGPVFSPFSLHFFRRINNYHIQSYHQLAVIVKEPAPIRQARTRSPEGQVNGFPPN